MKKLTIPLIIPALLLGSIFICHSALAASKAEQYLGEPEMCLEVHRIKETRIIDNQTILFIMRGGERYLSRLPVSCSGLKISNGFSYATSISKLCMQDSISVIPQGSALGSTCPLGEFIPFKSDLNDSQVEKLLEDGLLKELVAEGAFKEAFPSEK